MSNLSKTWVTCQNLSNSSNIKVNTWKLRLLPLRWILSYSKWIEKNIEYLLKSDCLLCISTSFGVHFLFNISWFQTWNQWKKVSNAHKDWKRLKKSISASFWVRPAPIIWSKYTTIVTRDICPSLLKTKGKCCNFFIMVKCLLTKLVRLSSV